MLYTNGCGSQIGRPRPVSPCSVLQSLEGHWSVRSDIGYSQSYTSIVNGEVTNSFSFSDCSLEDCLAQVVSLFAIWGLAQLVICLLCILVVVRYRSMIPFMFALLLLEHLSRKLILHFLPLAKTGTSPGFAVDLVLLALMIVGLALSLRSQDNLRAQE